MADSAPESVTVPVKVPEPADHAPPTLAEPASGAVAEMSGAIAAEKTAATEASTTADSAAVNGASEPTSITAGNEPAKSSENLTSEAAATGNDSETKEATTTADDNTTKSNGTQDSTKTPNGKRKSVGGVPEHSKGKKLNKKKSMQKITHLDAQPGELYFARLKSYPPWPSVICDEDMLPSSLLNSRPVTTKKSDGTYNEPYADGGKKVQDRTFPIMFLHTNEFAWIPNTDLAPLTPEECKEVQEKGKAKALLAAYEVAAEGHDLSYFKEMLADHANAIQEDEDRKAAKEAEKVAKAEKKKRKSEVKPQKDEDVEMEDVDGEAAPKKASKKRKKDVADEDEGPEKPAKTPKTTKIKLTTNKTPTTTEKQPKEPKATKAKSSKKSKAAEVDEEMPDAQEKEEEPPVDPVEARKAREKEVLFLRHRLQKGFLSRDQAPQEDEMPQMATYIKKLEAYGEKLEVGIIRNTKINKVLKALIKLNTIPKDEEFHFRERSMKLLSAWNTLLGAEPTDEKADKDAKASPATTNGVHKDAEEKAEESIEKEVEEPAGKVAESSEVGEKVSVASADTETKAEVTKAPGKETEPTKAAAPETAASAETGPKEASTSGTVEKAPESAEAAAEITNVVKATE